MPYPEISVTRKVNLRTRRQSGSLIHPWTCDGIGRPDTDLTARVEAEVGSVSSLDHARIVSPTITRASARIRVSINAGQTGQAKRDQANKAGEEHREAV